MKTTCEHCGKETNVILKGEEPDEEQDEGPEVEVSIEGDPDSVRSLLSKLIPEKED